MKGSKSKGVYAWAVDRKGSTASNVISRVLKWFDELGYNKVILKTDQEPAIKEFTSEARIERTQLLTALIEEINEHSTVMLDQFEYRSNVQCEL